MDKIPATLNTKEKARKYHFFPRKSMFGWRRKSTSYQGPFYESENSAPNLNAERFAALLAAQQPVENHSRNEHRGKQVRQQTEGQRDCESAHRSGTEDEQNKRRNNGGHVRVNDRDPGMAESLLDCGSGGFSVTQLFTNALENQYVRIDAHTNRQDDTGDPGQCQGGAAEAQKAQKNDQVEDEGDIGIHARATVVNQHENQNRQHTDDGGLHTRANRIRSQRWPNRTLFQILDAGRQRAGIQSQRQIFGRLLGHPAAADSALIVNLFLNVGDFANTIVEHHRQPVIYVRKGKRAKLASAFIGQRKLHVWSAAGRIAPHAGPA